VNRSILRNLARPIGGLAIAAAVVGVPSVAASAAEVPTVRTATAVPAENSYCDWESGYGCASYGYHGYPSDHDWDSGYDYRGSYHRHGRHHRY
jgi:hypothetical protein